MRRILSVLLIFACALSTASRAEANSGPLPGAVTPPVWTIGPLDCENLVAEVWEAPILVLDAGRSSPTSRGQTGAPAADPVRNIPRSNPAPTVSREMPAGGLAGMTVAAIGTGAPRAPPGR